MSAQGRSRIPIDRHQILGFRRAVGALDARMEHGPAALRHAAWAGLQDSVPRSAVLSLHARVRGIGPSDWEAAGLEQIWGPRYAAYVVPGCDRAVFTLGRLPDDTRGRDRAESMAMRLREHLAGGRRRYDDAGRELGVNPNALRYGATTGTVLIRWDGARRPVVWTVAVPNHDPAAARRELVRRYLHVLGPGTWQSFAEWAGVSRRAARATFAALQDALLPVSTPIGDGWILASDEDAVRRHSGPVAGARLLPSGDPYFLHQGAGRELLVADPAQRAQLWPSRVWPGAVLVDGEIQGTWRRTEAKLTIQAWGSLSRDRRAAVEAEADALPLSEPRGSVEVVWSD